MQKIKVAAKERQRVTLACDGCRKKRTKCDGHRPQCGACKYREESCEYSQVESKRRPPSKQYVKALEMRVSALEKQLANVDSTIQNNAILSESWLSLPYEATFLPQSCSLPELEASNANRTRESIDPVDELADVLGSFALGDAGELRYFGSRGNFNLSQEKNFSQETSSLGARLTGIESAHKAVGAINISDELRDHLLELFWTWQNSWQYLVPRESFLHDLHVEKSSRFCTPLLLSAILALSSRYSDAIEVRSDPEDPNTAGNLFAAQAKAMLWCECEAPTTPTVQAAGLLALQSCAVDKEALGWTFCGMAIRMAFSLGLHLDCSEHVARGMLSTDEAEARNVAWWGVYVLDELFAVGLGRPSGIQDFDITAKRPAFELEEEQASQSYSHETGLYISTWHIAMNVHYTCELLRITDTLDKLYASGNSWTKHERKDHVMKTHLQLLAFHNGLPRALRISESSLQPAMPHVYQLHLQYHASMILLHRPLIQGFPRGGQRISKLLDDDIHAQACKMSAEKISTILRAFKSTYSLRYIPISAVQCIFTAGVIHLLDATCEDSPSNAKSMRRLKDIMNSLYEIKQTWQWSNRSIRALGALAKEWGVHMEPNSACNTEKHSLSDLLDSTDGIFFDIDEIWGSNASLDFSFYPLAW